MCKRDVEEPYLCISQTKNIDNDLYCDSKESNQLHVVAQIANSSSEE